MEGNLQIKCDGEIWRDKNIPGEYDLCKFLKSYLVDLRPALRRGEEIEINITFNKKED